MHGRAATENQNKFVHKLRDLANLLDMDDIFIWDSFVKGTVVIAEAVVYCYPYCAETSPDQNRNHDYSRAWNGSDK